MKSSVKGPRAKHRPQAVNEPKESAHVQRISKHVLGNGGVRTTWTPSNVGTHLVSKDNPSPLLPCVYRDPTP